MTAEFAFHRCPFRMEDSKSHAAAVGLFRLTPGTITQVKEEEICVFTRDEWNLNTAPSLLSTRSPADYADKISQ